MKKILDKLENNRRWTIKNKEKLGLGSEPKPLFVNGKFNEDNWNGGDDVIRQYIMHIEDSNKWNRIYIDKNKIVSVSFICDDDEDKRISFVVIDKHGTYKMWDFSWYKNRGKIEQARYCGFEMMEYEYVELLQIIEETIGFKFSYH